LVRVIIPRRRFRAPISALDLTVHDPKSALRTPNSAIAMLPDDYSIEDANADFFD
jgi:hypothetical protein